MLIINYTLLGLVVFSSCWVEEREFQVLIIVSGRDGCCFEDGISDSAASSPLSLILFNLQVPIFSLPFKLHSFVGDPLTLFLLTHSIKRIHYPCFSHTLHSLTLCFFLPNQSILYQKTQHCISVAFFFFFKFLSDFSYFSTKEKLWVYFMMLSL